MTWLQPTQNSQENGITQEMKGCLPLPLMEASELSSFGNVKSVIHLKLPSIQVLGSKQEVTLMSGGRDSFENAGIEKLKEYSLWL